MKFSWNNSKQKEYLKINDNQTVKYLTDENGQFTAYFLKKVIVHIAEEHIRETTMNRMVSIDARDALIDKWYNDTLSFMSV